MKVRIKNTFSNSDSSFKADFIAGEILEVRSHYLNNSNAYLIVDGKNKGLFIHKNEVEPIIEPLKLKIKKLHPDAVIPTKGTEFSAGYDITAIDCEIIEENNLSTIVYKTGLAVQLPPNHVGLLVPRSSLSKNTTLMLQNHCGILDADYTGEIIFKFRDFINNVPNRAFTHSKKYEINERIGQLVVVPIPNLELELVDELDESKRGIGGFGHTGK